MRNSLSLFIIVLSFSGYSQDAEWGIRSIEQNNGFSFTISNYYEFGHNWGVGITAEFDEHLFALRFNFGGELHFSSKEINEYHNLNFMYGREFPINDWFILEGLIGIGYVNFRKENQAPDWIRRTNRAFNVPISLKVLFVTGKVFSMGINPNAHLNSFRVLYTANLTFQFKLR